MTTYTWPGSGAFRQTLASVGFVQNQRISTSTLNGAVQTTGLPGARLRQTVTFPLQTAANRAQLEALLNRLSGAEHRLSLWDLVRPVPRGTCNRTGVTASAAAQFATSIVLNGCGANATLLAGDWFRVAVGSLQQVVQASADATANGSGVMTVEFRAMLRGAVAGSSAVVLDKPTALYIVPPADGGLMVPRIVGGVGPEFTVDFLEMFS